MQHTARLSNSFVYRSLAMHELVELAEKVAPSDAPILVTGPNGSGKELIAELLQRRSLRADKPFIRVNAGAIPDTLIEAELFGAEAGAYTGATRARRGHIDMADGGTLFLDEIGNLGAAGQAKLLRVLQSGEYHRLGSATARRADVRVISATNVDLAAAIAAGTFREDLYYRLCVIELRVPPLAQRRDDILPIAEALLARGEPALRKRLGAAARRALHAHAFSGNVRELQNRILRAQLVSRGEEITPDDLDLAAPSDEIVVPLRVPERSNPERSPESADRTSLEALLRASGGNVSRVATSLGVSRQALYRRMERLGIRWERGLRVA